LDFRPAVPAFGTQRGVVVEDSLTLSLSQGERVFSVVVDKVGPAGLDSSPYFEKLEMSRFD